MPLWCYRGGRVLYEDADVEKIIATEPYQQFYPADFADWERIMGEPYVRCPAEPKP